MPTIPQYRIVSTKRGLTRFFLQDFNFFFGSSEMSSTHCFLRTENWSICHKVVSAKLLIRYFNASVTFLLHVLEIV